MIAAGAALLASPDARAGQEGVLSAEHVEVDLETYRIEARGDVRLVAPPLVLGADLLVLDVASGSMLLEGAQLRLGLPSCSASARAARASATADRIVLEAGSLHLCTCTPPPWSLSFGRLVLGVDGDLEVRRGWVKLGRARVLPVPWILMRTGRKAGLLPPRIGYSSTRGFLLGLGASFPLPRSTDLELAADWLALDGLGIAGSLESAGHGLSAALTLDPVDEGLDAAWIAGTLQAGTQTQHVGLVADSPLTTTVRRGDMPGADGAASRTALQSLSVRLAPGTPWLSFFGEAGSAVSLAPALASSGHGVLRAGEAWVQAPGVVLSLLPVRILGPRVPLLVRADLHHSQLVEVSALPGSVRLEASGLDLDLTGHWLPGRVVDLVVRGGWHGALLRHTHEQDPSLLLQAAGVGAEASLSLMSRASPAGFAHRLDLGLAYRGCVFSRWGAWHGPESAVPPSAPPPHLVGVVLGNGLVATRGEVLALSTSAWLLPSPRRVMAVLSFGLELRAGLVSLRGRLDLPSDCWAPSLASASLSVGDSRLVITLEHLYLARASATSLDVDTWLSTRLGAGVPPGRERGLHAALIGARLPVARGLSLGGRAGLDIDGRDAAWLECSISFSHPCECLAVRLGLLQRSGVGAPDVLLTLSM